MLLVAILVTQAPARWQIAVAAFLGLLGLLAILISVISHTRGLRMVTPQLRSEDFLGNNLEVFKGILLGSTPASIFAFRFGKSRPNRSAIVWTGLWALWLPLVLSVTLAALAKMAGVRLYWRPSAVIDSVFAFILISRTFRIDVFVSLIILSLVSIVAPIFFITDPVRGARLPLRLVILATAGAVGLWLTSVNGAVVFGVHLPLYVDESAFQCYFLPWCWSILIAGAACGCSMAATWLVARARDLFAGSRFTKR